jgi:hypothetical protein
MNIKFLSSIFSLHNGSLFMASIGVVFCAGKGCMGGGEWSGTIEAEVRRATTQQSVLFSLAGGEGLEGR